MTLSISMLIPRIIALLPLRRRVPMLILHDKVTPAIRCATATQQGIIFCPWEITELLEYLFYVCANSYNYAPIAWIAMSNFVRSAQPEKVCITWECASPSEFR